MKATLQESRNDSIRYQIADYFLDGLEKFILSLDESGTAIEKTYSYKSDGSSAFCKYKENYFITLDGEVYFDFNQKEVRLNFYPAIFADTPLNDQPITFKFVQELGFRGTFNYKENLIRIKVPNTQFQKMLGTLQSLIVYEKIKPAGEALAKKIYPFLIKFFHLTKSTIFHEFTHYADFLLHGDTKIFDNPKKNKQRYDDRGIEISAYLVQSIKELYIKYMTEGHIHSMEHCFFSQLSNDKDILKHSKLIVRKRFEEDLDSKSWKNIKERIYNLIWNQYAIYNKRSPTDPKLINKAKQRIYLFVEKLAESLLKEHQ